MYYISGWWFQPLWKIWKSVGIMFSPYMEKCSKPPNRYNITYPSSKLCILELVFPPSFAPCEDPIFPPLTLLTLLTRAENKTNVSELYMICWPFTLLQCSSRCCKSQQHECEHHREKKHIRGEQKKKQPMALGALVMLGKNIEPFFIQSCELLDTRHNLEALF